MSYYYESRIAPMIGAVVNRLRRNTDDVVSTDNAVAAEIEFLGIVESERIAEPIADDPPVQCDNSRSQSEKTFNVRAARTWRRQYVIQAENTRTEGSSASVGFNREVTAKVERTLQQTLRESSSRTYEQQETFEQSVSVTVPAGVQELITLSWKRIWQLGYVKMLVDGTLVEVPFKEQVGVAFDIK